MASSDTAIRQQQSALRLLDHTIDGLVRRQRRRQYIRSVSDSLFWGLGTAAIIVFCLRLARQPYSVLLITLCVVGLTLVIALFITSRRLPDKLSVAIVADEKLQFKQRLSTAYEYRQSQPDSDLTSALALQAGGARLPSVSSVFPFELNLWGMLVPLAVCLLVLANLIELETPEKATVITQIDQIVIEEGARLEAFARRMRQRAEQEGYARSLTESVDLQELGATMKSGAVLREQALHRLQKLQRSITTQRSAAVGDALESGSKYHTNKLSAGSLNEAQGSEFTTLRDKLSSGQLSANDLKALNRSLQLLEGSEFSREQLKNAFDRHNEGKSRELQRILDRLSEGEQAFKDAEQLEQARVAILKSRQNLGEETDTEQGAGGEGSSIAGGESGELGAEANYALTEFPGDAIGGGAGMNRVLNSSELENDNNRDAADDSEDTQVTLKPEVKLQEGASFRSEAWTLPKPGTPAVSKVQLDTKFEKQLEAVLSKETYPLHRKEFVRRYFLNLSTNTGRQQTSGENKMPEEDKQ